MATFHGQPGSSHAGRFAVCRHGDPFARHRYDPAVSEATNLLDKTPVPGLPSRDVALLVIMMPVSMMRLGTGRTNILFGLVHLIVFTIFLLPGFVP